MRKTKVGKKAKERLDKFYHLAKEQGYRARSAFKLVQLNKKFDFLSSARSLVDLCAAPGGWLQVATKTMPVSSLIVGVDIVPIRPIQNVTTITADITTAACRAAIHKALHSWKADVVLHDGSPNVGTVWIQDAFSQNELVLAALRLATEILHPGGTFVTKVFRSRDYNAILTTLRKLFAKVTASKPAASRSTSAEVFVVCQGYTAPHRVDPALFDSRSVFSVTSATDSGVAVPVISVMSRRSTKPRKAAGYEDDVGALVTKRVPAAAFVTADDPLAVLSTATEIFFGPDDAAIRARRETTADIVESMRDLKILGRSDFKAILTWREAIRRSLFPKKKAGQEAEEKKPMTEEEERAAAVASLEASAKKLSKQERKREQKKEKRRLKQMERSKHAGLDMAHDGQDASLFSLTEIPMGAELVEDDPGDKVPEDVEDDDDDEAVEEKEEEEEGEEGDTDDEARREEELESRIDYMYRSYIERKRGKKVQVRIEKKKRKVAVPKLVADDPYNEMPVDEVEEAAELSAGSEPEEIEPAEPKPKPNELVVTTGDIVGEIKGDDDEAEETEMAGDTMSRKAADWFGSSVFEGIGLGRTGEDDEEFEHIEEEEGEGEAEEVIDSEEEQDSPAKKKIKKEKEGEEEEKPEKPEEEEEEKKKKKKKETKKKKKDKADGDFEVVPLEKDAVEIASSDDEAQGAGFGEDDDGTRELPVPALGPHMGREDLATALAIGRKIAMSKSARERLIDDSYNRWSFDDGQADLPEWFVEDETAHCRPIAPVTKEQIEAEKKRLEAIDARPIKKVVEARARKRQRGERRQELIREKASQINNQADIDEQEKARLINRLYHRAAKHSSKRTKTVLVDGKTMRRIGGAKSGRTKLVDSRMKKDTKGGLRLEEKKQKGLRKRRHQLQEQRSRRKAK